jgi:hypothetical protein
MPARRSTRSAAASMPGISAGCTQPWSRITVRRAAARAPGLNPSRDSPAAAGIAASLDGPAAAVIDAWSADRASAAGATFFLSAAGSSGRTA